MTCERGMETLALTFLLESPLAVSHRLCLESVLAAVHDRPAISLPIVQDAETGIFRASQGLFSETLLRRRQYARTGGLIVRDQEGIRHAVGRTREATSLYSNFPMTTVTARHVGTVRFYVETEDAEALIALCQDIPALGKWSRKGFGTVSQVTGGPTDHKDPWVLPGEDGRPGRALPVSLWRTRYGAAPYAVAYEAVVPPYWEAPPILAAVPDSDPTRSLI